MTSPRILLVEYSDDDADLLLRELRRGGISPQFYRVDAADGVKQALSQGSFDVVISDVDLPCHDFPQVLKSVREHDPCLPFIVVSGSIGEENAVALMRQGVTDFVFRDRLWRLIPTIHRELSAAAQQQARRESDQRFRDIAEVSGDWIWETDAEHRYTFFSNGFRDGKGANPAASLGKTRWELAGVDPKERRGLAGAFC